jgi:SAM-dependent methyltransferase
MTCPACTSPDTKPFLSRCGVPVHQNALFADEADARSIERGELAMTVCRACGFVFNAAFDPARIHYDETYDNNQICSPVFSDYVDGLVAYLLDDQKLRGGTFVEVGCGKGYFLEKIIAADPTTRGIGFDPTYLGDLSAYDGRLQFERTFYGPDSRHVAADAVVCRHVIEHVADPAAMLLAVRRALDDVPDARVYFETPCVEWILRNHVVWDFFYEHCSLFTAGSITRLFERCGFEVVNVRHVFDGQYLWTEARPSCHPERRARDLGGRGTGQEPQAPSPTHPGPSLDARDDNMVALAESYAATEQQLIARLQTRIDELRRDGEVAIWGAGAKGVTFAHLVDQDRGRIACVVDLNPRKQGHFVPATGHPIVDYRDLPRLGVRSALVMNPNYIEENRELLRAAGLDVRLYLEEN